MKRMQGFGFVILILVFILVEYYTFSALRFSIKGLKPVYRNWILIIYGVVTLAWIASFFFFPAMRTSDMNKTLKNFLISFSMGLLITKVLIGAILFIDDLRRGMYLLTGLFYSKQEIPQAISSGMSRSEFLNSLALLLGGSVFTSLIYGMTNRYNYNTKKVSLNYGHLPNAFKGFKIVQISDIHSGSLNNKTAILKGIQKINDLKPDVIFFTGDLVNNRSSEMQPFMDVFNQLKAPHGVYSILGNHDYGDYVGWDTPEAKKENLNELKRIHQQLGWRLLLDEHEVIEKNGDKLAVLGVENTSFKNRFPTYGNLSKAYLGSEDIPFKILLSHDPSHWDGEINTKYKDIALTLSGHTHGFQFGVEIPWLKWSPVQYIYKQWAGLYSQGEQHLYVNRGFGFLGYPGRVGMLPEITLIELT